MIGDRPTLPWTETDQVGLTRNLCPITTMLAPLKSCLEFEALASRVFLESTCPGHEPWTMRLFGWCRRPFGEIRSRDRAAVARSGASIARFRLVSLGPFHKARSTTICQGNIHSTNPLLFWSTRYGVECEFYQEAHK